MKNWFTPRKKKATLHPKIKFLLGYQYQKELELLQQWIDDFTSPDGELKSIDEFQTTFHSVFLELYINQLLRFSGAKVDTEQERPDFKAQKSNLTYFVEATVANISESGTPESERTEQDAYGKNDQYKILDEAISRIRRRIGEKSRDFHRYCEEAQASPFVIAIGDFSQINYGQGAYYAPLAVLYNAYYDPDDKTDLKILCEDSFDREYKYKE